MRYIGAERDLEAVELAADSPRLLIAGAAIAVLIVAASLLLRSLPESVSALLFILVVIVEVVIAPIPGGVIGYMGAARFGFWEAWPLLYIGNAIGTTLVFLLTRRLGAQLFRASVSDETRQRYDCLLQQHPRLLWAIYSMPLVPLDVLSALAALSSIPARKFLRIALAGYLLNTGIVALLGDFAAEVVGVTQAISALGIVLLGALVWWLWRARSGDTPRC